METLHHAVRYGNLTGRFPLKCKLNKLKSQIRSCPCHVSWAQWPHLANDIERELIHGEPFLQEGGSAGPCSPLPWLTSFQIPTPPQKSLLLMPSASHSSPPWG